MTRGKLDNAIGWLEKMRESPFMRPNDFYQTIDLIESAEKCRVGEPGYPTANGRQVKNGTGVEEIERGTLDLQVGTAKPGTETVPNCGTKPRQSAECAWCGPGRIGWFSVQFWVRACYGKRKWMSVTQDWKKKVKHCPMCGRKLEVEG